MGSMHMSSVTRTRIRFACLGGVLLLAGCGSDGLSRTFGLTRDSPDEFLVTTRAPLSMPPDYTLRPPTPGIARPQERTDRQQAEATLAPQAALGAGTAGMTPGQQALLQQVGPAAPAGIRSQVNTEASQQASNRSLTDRLLFWRVQPQPGIVVDPTAEAQRLRTNAALGRNDEVGNTPIIQPKSTNIWSKLF